MERISVEKHEYYDGYVFAMGEASLTHNYIAMNLYKKIGGFLEDKDCKILPSEMRVSTPNRDTYIYPDATIVCDKPELEDDKFDTLLNPTVVFEILSPSTSKNDIGYKLLYYQNIPSIREYIMIDCKKRYVQNVHKQPDHAWRITNITKPVGELIIHSINFTLLLDEIYYNTGL